MILIKWSLEEGEISREEKPEAEIRFTVKEANKVECKHNKYEHYRIDGTNTFFTVATQKDLDKHIRGMCIKLIKGDVVYRLPLFYGINRKTNVRKELIRIQGYLRADDYDYSPSELCLKVPGAKYQGVRVYRRDPKKRNRRCKSWFKLGAK